MAGCANEAPLPSSHRHISKGLNGSAAGALPPEPVSGDRRKMIRYALRCARGHAFESWFASAETFDRLAAAGALNCAVCGGGGVEKTLMAPAVGAGRSEAPAEKEAAPPAETAPAAPALSAPGSPLEAAIRALRAKVEATAENVGRDFARQAREMHEGEADPRPIYGETTREEARDLLDDGVPVLPLPWTSRQDG